jgi:glycerol-3-phosphate O-acyltransferase
MVALPEDRSQPGSTGEPEPAPVLTDGKPTASVWQRLRSNLNNLFFSASQRLLNAWLRPTFLNNNLETLGLEADASICFALHFRSAVDLQMVDQACRVGGLPSPRGPITGVDENRSFFFIGHSEGTLGRRSMRGQSERMTRLFDYAADDDHDINIVPVSLFWGHQPDREKSLFRLLLSENWVATSGFKKFLAILFHPHHILVQFGQPIPLREIAGDESQREIQIRKLLRLLRVHFNNERQAIIGPDLSHRRTLIDTMLASPEVRAAIEREARNARIDEAKVEKKALGYAREIASDQSYRVIRFFDTLLTWLWNNLYNGIDVNGIARVKELAQTHEIVYIPCHRSHIDYLLLSYVLYHNGLTPPHIAAGKNLNLPLIGPLLRRAGAFYMRRSFQGDALYRVVFDEYLHQMFTRGYSVEYFIEGGRSRTGRTLPPRTGMLSMTVRSFQRDSTKPIALMPVYFGYERVLESATYRAELSGSNKKSESLFDVFKIFSSFKHDFGQVTVNFGEALLLRQYLDEHLPGWSEDNTSSQDFSALCTRLADDLATRINSAVAVNSTGLLALALLATSRERTTERQLVTQVEILRQIATRFESDLSTVADAPAPELIDEALSITGLSRQPLPFGSIVAATPEQSVNLTYNANNVLHVFALPSLICRYALTHPGCRAADITAFIRDLYPYFKAEMFLPWETAELDAAVTATMIKLTETQLLQINPVQGDVSLPAPESVEFSCMQDLGNLTDATLERFYIVLSLLQQDQHLTAKTLESAAAKIAAQLSALYGINSPDFFEKSLFSTFVSKLKAQSVISADLSASTGLHAVEAVIAETIDANVRYNIRHAVSSFHAAQEAAE